MIDNAVAHYHHLIDQGKSPIEAIDHVRLRFGVSQTDLISRVMGNVADSDRTKRALAEARVYLTSGGLHEEVFTEAHRLLSGLYSAVTGESL